MQASRVACVQMTSGIDLTENLKTTSFLIKKAVEKGAKLVILPEMFCALGLTPQETLNLSEKKGQGAIQEFLSKEAKRYGIWLIGGTLPIKSEQSADKVFATCLVYDDKGQCVTAYQKIHLFDVEIPGTQEVHLESALVSPGTKSVVISTPFGKIGLAVCYDIRFPEMFRQMLTEEMEILALPTAFTFTTGQAHWESLIRARAIENQIYVLAACQTGSHPNGRKTYGHSMIVNPWGEIQALLREGSGVVISDMDLNYLHQLRREFPVLLHRK